MKNTITEMTNAPRGINNTLNDIEGHIRKLGDTAVEVRK